MTRHSHTQAVVGRPKRQRGAAMVEFALGVTLFLLLVFGGFEFSRMLLEWGRTVEATRAGVRLAVVTTPPSGCDLGSLECPGGSVVCSPDADSSLLAAMQRRQPLIAGAENVRLTYACSITGAARRLTPVRLVRVEVEGLEFEPVVPGLLGIPAAIAIPAFPSTQIGESLRDLEVSAP
ncbi:TadE/TadG family type IV pilus assembly protein [Halorhodospira sp. 9622]|uniref:TadE/TadG family type IV pilus assembly protein n=1 Tax=Halorhodospira sp. 9622 TaxID=2899136 RepID=UPI001EE9430B|nr:TadE family protein [Halorhodospira sp. 9622]MCG5538636.1 pilus assembly protein [Halorhodospira sp. 9622]